MELNYSYILIYPYVIPEEHLEPQVGWASLRKQLTVKST